MSNSLSFGFVWEPLYEDEESPLFPREILPTPEAWGLPLLAHKGQRFTGMGSPLMPP